MGKINLDIINNKFNLLTVISFIGLNKHNSAIFLCKCDCGNEKVLIGKEVKSGQIKSCGCYKPKIKEKHCVVCNKLYSPNGRCSKYCSDECKKENTKGKSKIYSYNYRYKKAIINNTLDKLGVGKGGSQLKGKNSIHYKNGIGYFHKRSKEIRKEKRYCERCDKDLKLSKHGYWCVHHKDYDRDNNDESNFELLCKKCHQIEHKCWEAFKTH